MAGFCSATAAIYAVAGVEPAVPVVLLLLFGPALSVGLWIEQDAHTTGVGAVMDFGWFACMAWPVVLPWYAFKSRGRSGWKLLVALLALMLAPQITQAVLYALLPSLNN